MPLRTPEPPANALNLISDAIRRVSEAAPEATRTMTIGGAEPRELDAVLPLQVYTLGLDAIETGDLTAATAVGWRYLLMRREHPIAAVELDAPIGRGGKPGRLRFSHFNEGPFVEESLRAVSQAENMDETAVDDFEIRILRIPALFVMAVWLHGDKKDILLPMPPTHEQLNPNEPYTAKKFLSRLTKPSQERATFDDTPTDFSSGRGDSSTRKRKK